MIRVATLTPEQTQSLTAMMATTCRRESDRIRAVFAAAMQATVSEIQKVLGYSKNAIRSWLKNWNKYGLESIKEKPRSGRKKKVSPEVFLEALAQWHKQAPQQIKLLMVLLYNTWAIVCCADTVRRYLAELAYYWKRIQKSLRGKQNPELVELFD